jgi:hypothetical protein
MKPKTTPIQRILPLLNAIKHADEKGWRRSMMFSARKLKKRSLAALVTARLRRLSQSRSKLRPTSSQ